jgi:hypothetical protein
MDNQDLMNDELVSRGKRMAVALSELPWWCHRGGGSPAATGRYVTPFSLIFLPTGMARDGGLT